MLHIILYQPEIPPNTGNIIRLCANTGAHLHLVEPLGFQLDSARVKRAGLDYREIAAISRHKTWRSFRDSYPAMPLWSYSTAGEQRYDQVEYSTGDGLVFGPETRGLPRDLLLEIGMDRCLRLPMTKSSRSLNLSNTVAVGLYEAGRQLRFEG